MPSYFSMPQCMSRNYPFLRSIFTNDLYIRCTCAAYLVLGTSSNFSSAWSFSVWRIATVFSPPSQDVHIPIPNIFSPFSNPEISPGHILFEKCQLFIKFASTISNYVDEVSLLWNLVGSSFTIKIRCRKTFDPHGASLRCCCSISRLRRVRSTIGLINGTISVDSYLSGYGFKYWILEQRIYL